MKSKSYHQRIAELRHQRAQLIVHSTVLREALAVEVQQLQTPIHIAARAFSVLRFLFEHPWVPTLLSSVVLARGARGIGHVVKEGVSWWRTAHAVMDIVQQRNK